MEKEWIEKSYKKARDGAGSVERRRVMDSTRNAGESALVACLNAIPIAQKQLALNLWDDSDQTTYSQTYALEKILNAVTGREIDSDEFVSLKEEDDNHVTDFAVRYLFYRGILKKRIRVRSDHRGKELWIFVNKVVPSLLRKELQFNGGQPYHPQTKRGPNYSRYAKDPIIKNKKADLSSEADFDTILDEIKERVAEINNIETEKFAKKLKREGSKFLEKIMKKATE